MTDGYVDSDFANPSAVCDVIMKGGITSGVVYPLALTEVAQQFRLSQVGGTSAGAIAAAAAAAAEYGRHAPGGGFVRLAKLPAEVGRILFSLFQPIPALQPVFDIAVAAIGNASTATKVMRVIGAALAGFAVAAGAGALPGLLILVAGRWHSNLALAVLGLLLLLIGILLGVAFCLYRAITTGIPDNDFGLCPGKTQPGNSSPGLSDWLADMIDDIAGRDPTKDPPLTFGDLSPADGAGVHKITLRMMTTNLTLRRPYSLPFNEKIYAFRLADFERLFPARIASYLATHCEKADDSTGEYGDLYKFPEPENLPVVVATRMSLSFPLLFCAVPLYARDFTFASEAERAKWRKHLFSDGGLSNNFPIQFFDRMLPNSPTFGITLDDFSEKRVPKDISEHYPPNDPHSRVWLPKTKSAGSGVLIPGEPLHGLPAFFSRLLDAAMSWQDNLQSTLPGYRDRIVHVGLKSDEGGLNITMPPELVSTLSSYGARAGIDMRDEFDLDEHRWRRFLVAMDRMDHTLDEIAAAYNGQGGIESFAAFLNRYPNPPKPVSYQDAARDHLETLKTRLADLAELSRRWEAQLQIPDAELPHPKTDLRITPRP
jgi:predicted acylesterase/phospholipase RssA